MPGVFTHGNFDTWSPGLPDVHRRDCTTASAASTRRSATAAPTRVERTLQPDRVRAHLVQAESAAAESEVVAAQQQQLRADRPARLAASTSPTTSKLFLRELLPEEQALDPEAEDRRAGGVRLPGDDPRPGRAGRAAARAAEAGRRDLARDGAVHRHGARARKRRRAAHERRRRTRRPTAGRADRRSDRAASTIGRTAEGDQRQAAPRRRRAPSRPAATSSAWTSRTAASPTRCSTISTGRPNDPQKHAVRRHRLDVPRAVQRAGGRASTDVKVLDAPMETVNGERAAPGRRHRHRHRLRRQSQRRQRAGDAALPAQGRVSSRPPRSRSKPAGKKFNRGSFIIRNVARRRPAARRRPSSGLQVVARRRGAVGEDASGARAARRAAAHLAQHADRRLVAPGVRPRCRCRSPTSARRTSRRTPTCNAKYDVILFPPVGRGAGRRSSTACRCAATRCRGRRPQMTPNLGNDGSDRRHAAGPRLDGRGATCRTSCARAALLIAVDDTADFAVAVPASRRGVSITPRAAAADRRQRRALEARRRDEPDRLRLQRQPGDLLRQTVRSSTSSNLVGGRGGRGGGGEARDRADRPRHAGRSRLPQGRAGVGAGARRAAASSRGRRRRSRDEQLRNGINVIPPAQRPRVVLRYADARDLLVSGLLDGGAEIAQHAAVVDVPRRQRATSCCSRTTRSGAARRRAATSWCSTRS